MLGRQLKCEFTTISKTMWPQHRCCLLKNADLSYVSKEEYLEFSGSNFGKQSTTAVELQLIQKVDFAPSQIFDAFPLLNGFSIKSSNIPVLKEDLFTRSFNRIRYLNLEENGIKEIEEESFHFLPELIWIALNNNKIRSLSKNFFLSNRRLEYINFENNRIKIITSTLFENLANLKLVNLKRNKCVTRNIGCKHCSFNKTRLHGFLETCYNQFSVNLGFLEKL